MVVITGDNNCTDTFDEGLPDYETVEIKAVTKGKKAGSGWIDFEAGLEAASDVWVCPTGREATKAADLMIMSFSSGTTGFTQKWSVTTSPILWDIY